MTTKATSTKFVKLQRGDGATSESFTTIGEIKSFDGPADDAPTLDASSFDSAVQEYIAGLPSPGEVSGTMNFVASDAQQQGLRSDLLAGTRRNFKLIFNDHPTTPTVFAFAAIVMHLSPSGSTNGILEQKFTLKRTGTTTYTYAPAV